MNEDQRFIYGYGATKHLPSGAKTVEWGGRAGYELGLCGAAGGYPREEPERPTCKRCLKKASRS